MISQLYADDRGVSPVVGVALLIAVTVILAAVIGFVVLDTSTSSTNAKNARLDFSGTTVSHEGGDTFDPANVVVKANGSNSTLAGEVGSTFNTGDSFDAASVTGATINSGDTIVVYWDDPDSDREVQIGQTTVE